MENSKLVKGSLAHALGVLVYVSAVAWIMKNGERIFGQMDNLAGPIAFLLLFVLSATLEFGICLG